MDVQCAVQIKIQLQKQPTKPKFTILFVKFDLFGDFIEN